MTTLTTETERVVLSRTVHHMPETHDEIEELEDDSIHAIQGMEEVEAWPIDDVIGELIRTGLISKDEIIIHEELQKGSILDNLIEVITYFLAVSVAVERLVEICKNTFLKDKVKNGAV